MSSPAIPYYMNYVIFFNNQADYDAAVAISGSPVLQMTPRAAAARLGIPFPYPSGDMDSISKGIYFITPFVPGQQFRFPNPTGIFVDDTVLTTIIPGQAGVPASIWPAGPDGSFTWSANLQLNRGAGTSTTPPATAMAQRRWITGFEHPFETVTPYTASRAGRDFSRTIDGYGYATRGNNNNGSLTRQTNELRAVVSRTSWERFYFRVRRLPSTLTTGLWAQHGNLNALTSISIQMTTAGVVTVFNTDGGGVETSKGAAFTPNINQWYRIDLFCRVGNGSGNTILNLFVNGVQVFYNNTFTNSNTVHTDSTLGNFKGVDAECEIDFDDWISSDLPGNVDSTTIQFIDTNFSIDWLLGSHVRSSWVKSTTSSVNWTTLNGGGFKESANQQHTPAGLIGTGSVNSVTPSARLEFLTDVLNQATQDTIAPTLGVAAAEITYFNFSSDNSDGTLGYKKAGGADVLAVINQVAANSAQSVLYSAAGMILPDEISPWSTVHVKSGTAGQDFCAMLASTIEYLGVWGPEDDPAFDFPVTRLGFLHNARYGNTAYGYVGSQPDAPVFAVGGTYVGNGTSQEVALPTACHWLLIRPLAAPNGGIKIFGPTYGDGGHSNNSSTSTPQIRMFFDPVSATYKFSVNGAVGSENNVNGTTYQYIAFCDPGMRYCLGGCFGHGTSSSTPKVNPLIVSDFLADLGFFGTDFVGLNAAAGGFIRGPNNAANVVTPYGGGTDANGCNFAAGLINSFSSLHSGNGHTSYCLFRTADSGPGGCSSNVMVQVTTYIGNGSNPRNIPLTPVSGRFPLFVLVVPATNGSANVIYRDPSHTGTQSSAFGTGVVQAVNGITAVAIDQITIGSLINTNLVPYYVFAICGDTAGMNNGTYFATYCAGADGLDDPYTPPSLPLGDINISGNGGLLLGGSGAKLTLILDASGIYTLVPAKTNDTLIDRQAGQTTIDVKIPNPTWKTGYLGG